MDRGQWTATVAVIAILAGSAAWIGFEQAAANRRRELGLTDDHQALMRLPEKDSWVGRPVVAETKKGAHDLQTLYKAHDGSGLGYLRPFEGFSIDGDTIVRVLEGDGDLSRVKIEGDSKEEGRYGWTLTRWVHWP